MPDNKAIVSKLLDALWSKGQLSVVDELVSQDFVGYWPFPTEPVKGPAEYKELVTDMRKVFPDQTIKSPGRDLGRRNSGHPIRSNRHSPR